ncbi:MAG: tetratricopeptide repeat protein, partial [Candidatus Omnitrophica bacterium]|nr:tetratricopeptide repeat protein [Candidatus Omnitrophota bacterium]
WDEAADLIGIVRQRYVGRKEEKISENMMKRMRILKKRDAQIEELLQEIPEQKDEKVRELMEFRLGLAYLSIYEFNEAKSAFEKLGSAQDANIRQRSRFYIGWIYKLLGNLDQSKDVLEKLIDEKLIESEMRLALHAQLADICYREGNVQGAEEHYKAVKDSLKQEHLEKKAAMQSWLGLAEIERNTMFIHLGDTYAVEDLSDNLKQGMGIDSAEFLILKEEMNKAKTLNLRDEAFRRLRRRQVEDAKNLFEKYMKMHPGDAWSHSGIATCYLLSGDLKEAEEYANQGYNREGDEYTASMLAYVDMLSDKLPEAEGLYQVALRLNPDYFTAKFNLAYVYLKLREYQKAVEILEKLQQDFQNTSNDEIKARIMNNLGIARWWSGQKEEAIQLFNHVLDIKPGFRDAEQNLRQAIAGLEPGGMAAMDMTEAERQ